MVNQELLGIYLVLGLLSSFSPCLFPLLPSYVALTLNSRYPRRTIFFSSITLLLGIMIVFLTLGLLFSYSLTFVGRFLLNNYDVFKTIQGLFLIIAGILLIKTPSFMYKIRLPEKLEKLIYSENQNTKPYTLSFLIGLSYTIIALPCAGGIFITVWTGMFGEPLIDQLLLVLAFSIGAGLPFTIMSLYVPRFRSGFIQTVHNAQSKLTIALGIIIILTGIWLLTSDTSNFGASTV